MCTAANLWLIPAHEGPTAPPDHKRPGPQEPFNIPAAHGHRTPDGAQGLASQRRAVPASRTAEHRAVSQRLFLISVNNVRLPSWPGFCLTFSY